MYTATLLERANLQTVHIQFKIYLLPLLLCGIARIYKGKNKVYILFRA